MSGEPRLTQELTLHLNGSKFSEMHYNVMCDGVFTGITKHVITNGRPKYEVQAKSLVTSSKAKFGLSD